VDWSFPFDIDIKIIQEKKSEDNSRYIEVYTEFTETTNNKKNHLANHFMANRRQKRTEKASLAPKRSQHHQLRHIENPGPQQYR